jgi:hypothetical protein
MLVRDPQQIDSEEMILIRALHEKMNLDDDCCARLQLLQTNAQGFVTRARL